MNFFEVKKKKLKNFFLVGYLSYEFDMPKISTDYQAIFNIYSGTRTKLKKPKKNFIQKSYLEKTTTDTIHKICRNYEEANSAAIFIR